MASRAGATAPTPGFGEPGGRENGLAKTLMFCFCSISMTFANDNSPPAPEASRILPILGRVAADGRIVQRPGPAPVADPPSWSPNDPREA